MAVYQYKKRVVKEGLAVLMLFFYLGGFSQSSLIIYSREYEFKEGLFFTLNDFKKNTPVSKSIIVSSIPKDQFDFFKLLLEQKTIVFKDSSAKEQKVQTSSIWGYCQNRNVYLNFNNEFNKLNVIGTLCHFTATVKTYSGYHDPMNYNYGISPSYNELRQFVYDTQSNKVFDFNMQNMEMLLKSDDELYNQFMALKKREKPDSIFIYLRKFNEKHPLYLPAN
jgi:hypothetical protein